MTSFMTSLLNFRLWDAFISMSVFKIQITLCSPNCFLEQNIGSYRFSSLGCTYMHVYLCLGKQQHEEKGLTFSALVSRGVQSSQPSEFHMSHYLQTFPLFSGHPTTKRWSCYNPINQHFWFRYTERAGFYVTAVCFRSFLRSSQVAGRNANKT